MPQIFQVLKCYKCLIFQTDGACRTCKCSQQREYKFKSDYILKMFSVRRYVKRCIKVHFTKKSNKWECKMCGEKQSIKRHYGIGTAQECRGHVQKLNEIQGNKTESIIKNLESDDDDIQTCKESPQKKYASKKFKRQSKWAKFIEEEEDIPNADNEVECCEETGVLEVTKKRKPYKRPKEISNCNEYSKIELLNKKFCHQDSQPKQCNGRENINKWSTNMHKNKESFSESSKITLNANPKIRCNKLTELDSSQFITEAEIKDIEYNQENSKDIHIKRNIARNIATVKDTNLANKRDQPIEKNTKQYQFLKSEEGKTETVFESKTRTLFSLCDDNDIDSILDLANK